MVHHDRNTGGIHLITVKGLTKAKAVSDISFTVEDGHILGIAGAKGTGKTALLDIISGCVDADAGSVVIDGSEIATDVPSVKQLIGYVPQEAPLYRDLTLRAQLKWLAEARGIPSREAADRITALLELLNLKDVADEPLKSLSKSAKQLANIAQAVFHEPKAVLIDEPTAGLDPMDILTLRTAIKEIAKDRCVILATSNLTELCALCDEVAVLDAGKIVSYGTVGEIQNMTIIDNACTLVVKTDTAAAEKAFSGISGVKVTACNAEAGCSRVEVAMDGDKRCELFAAAAKAAAPIVEFVSAKKPLNELLASLSRERIEEGREEA